MSTGHTPDAAAAATSIVEGPVVAFQGERGAYADLAIETVWGAAGRRLPRRSFDAVVDSIASGDADYGVLPLTNAIIGPIPGVAQAIARAPLTLHQRRDVPIVHCVLAPHGAVLGELREVFSHPAALSQCTRWLEAHPHITVRVAYDTAGSAKDVAARGHVWEAAIASELCAVRYDLGVLARQVGDSLSNSTCFGVLSLPGMPPPPQV